jgi:hypothetical protein
MLNLSQSQTCQPMRWHRKDAGAKKSSHGGDSLPQNRRSGLASFDRPQIEPLRALASKILTIPVGGLVYAPIEQLTAERRSQT